MLYEPTIATHGRPLTSFPVRRRNLSCAYCNRRWGHHVKISILTGASGHR